jgi:RND family efflux transporter MFP subunit
MKNVIVRRVELGIVLACCGIGAACSRTRAAEAVADAPTVAVANVVRGDLAQTLTLAAEFRPFQEIDVHAKVAGYVKSIGVDVGDRVKAGQLLAVLEIPELQDDLTQADASAKRSEEEVKRAQADFERAQSAHEVAHLGSTRLASVMKARPNLVAQQDIDEALGRDRVSEAQVATAKAAIASAQEQLAVSEATRSKTKTLLDYARITAPFGGVITRRYADTGAMIQAGISSQTQTMPLVRLSQNTRLRLAIEVPESDVAQIRVGQPVDVRVQSLGRTFAGTVARFADKVNPDTRTMETEVDVPNPALTLVPGMYASAAITIARATAALIAPVQAIDRTGDSISVIVVGPGNKLEAHDVTLGIEAPDRVEIRSGLREGDRVVIGSRAELKPGATVTPQVTVLSAARGSR